MAEKELRGQRSTGLKPGSELCLPWGAGSVISALEQAGHEAYAVGGCVRDSLLGLAPHDWDICTSATPQEVQSCFSGRRIIETGLKHGTVTVLMEDTAYEVTTFRVDGSYSDSRHPDSVEFTSSLRDDLARRDFTINAMAYSDRSGLIDPFDGEGALRRGEIACVGVPADRFREDALRVMRALRFASTYGFSIREDTAEAIHAFAPRLKRIAAERIQAELNRLLVGEGALRVLLDYRDVMAVIIPELAPCIGFDQKNPYHTDTVYDHIAHAVSSYAGSDLSVKTALLLHDIGKPRCFTEDERGGHFYGHNVAGRDLADAVTRRLRYDNKTRDEVLTLILYHDCVIEPTCAAVRRWLNRIGETCLRKLLHVQMADISAHSEVTQASGFERCQALLAVLEEVLEQEQCFSIKDLAVSGRDIMSLGVPEGKLVGAALRRILDMVISGALPNEFEPQMQAARQYLEECAQVRTQTSGG